MMSKNTIISALFISTCAIQISSAFPCGFGCGLDFGSHDLCNIGRFEGRCGCGCGLDFGSRDLCSVGGFEGRCGCGCGCGCIPFIPACTKMPIYPPIEYGRHRCCCNHHSSCCCNDYHHENGAAHVPHIVSSIVASVLPPPLARIPLPPLLCPC